MQDIYAKTTKIKAEETFSTNITLDQVLGQVFLPNNIQNKYSDPYTNTIQYNSEQNNRRSWSLHRLPNRRQITSRVYYAHNATLVAEDGVNGHLDYVS